jgi:hypothetical protein
VALPALGSLNVLSTNALAQEDRPQIIPGERKSAKKKDAGPRAVAVLQMGEKGKTSLLPIAIMINGKFWDASAYKADPVPMALDSGTVYEAEQTGSSLGLFTVNGALHSNAANSPAPWLGTGSWHANGADEPKKEAHADKVPVGIEKEDAPPRLSHADTKSGAAPGTEPTGASNSGGAPSPSSAPKSETQKSSGSSNSGDEPPRLSKPSEAPATPPADASKPSGSQTSSAPSTPDAKTRDAAPQQANVPASDSGANEGNRPRLRRGKPPESFADEDIPGYSKPGASAPKPADSGKGSTAPSLADVKLIPAISDAGGPPPHSFSFEWLRGEEGDRQKQMTEMAKEQVRSYVAARERNKITAKPMRTATGTHRPKPAEPILENLKMVAYDLWNSNQPVIILSAEAHMPPPPEGTAHSEVQTELQYSVLLVAYPDIYNNLHKLYAGVTDKFHLDVTPRLELVDAVDADGDGRGELLFRQTTDMGTGWIIYRVTADKLWKMYDSLSPL